MAELHVNDSGTWRKAAGVYVNDSGTWRTIQEVYVNDGGTWRSVFVNFAPPSPFNTYDVWANSAPGDVATATISFLNDGTITYNFLDGDGGSTIGSSNWGEPTTTGIGSNYWIRLTATSGTFTTNDASGWTSLGSTVSATKSASAGSATVVFTIEIATDSGGTNVVLTSTGNQLRYTHI